MANFKKNKRRKYRLTRAIELFHRIPKKTKERSKLKEDNKYNEPMKEVKEYDDYW